MGLFAPSKTTRIEGTIDRIGVVNVSDMSLDYGFTLEGDRTRYYASAYPLKAQWDLALALPGDRVSFVVQDKRPHVVHAQFATHGPRRSAKGAA